MGAAVLMIIATSLLMGSINVAEAWKEETKVIHVGGKVLCQDCTQGWNEWLHGAKPIKGCKVSITCMDDRSRVVYYGSDQTDEGGDFEMTINKFINGKELNAKKCSVRLVSSPDPVCNLPTNFAGGRSGVKLSRPTLVYRDIIKHVLGPFYYTTPMCDEPDVSESHGKGNTY
ncbi:pistil-specific extensin-like protein [Cornus florida]|uniref:pistil-specific extensin-like protein n=1 Tax=Cornus florida TaxID=4283 RepID=UPI00289D965F|nr:pistil-specific extensin-like protein [Cornus florida]